MPQVVAVPAPWLAKASPRALSTPPPPPFFRPPCSSLSSCVSAAPYALPRTIRSRVAARVSEMRLVGPRLAGTREHHLRVRPPL